MAETDQPVVRGTVNTTRRDFPEAVVLSRRSLGKKEIARIYENEPAAKKQRLTWNRPDRVPIAPEDMIAGEWHKYLPYMKYLSYVYQNGKLMTTHGKLITLEEVPELDPQGQPLRPWIEGMIAIQDAAAIEADPGLCRFCKKYSAEDADDYVRHMATEHPGEVLKLAGETAAAPEIPKAEAEPLICCGRVMKNKAGFAAHTRLAHRGNPLHPE